MSRKVTEEQKKSILKEFTNGLNVKDISKIYNFTIVTINRQLRNMLGEEKFLKIKNKNFKNASKKIDGKKNNRLLIWSFLYLNYFFKKFT